MNSIILNHFRHIRFSMLLSIVSVFYACSNQIGPEPEKPFETEISHNYVIKVGKDKEYKTIAAAAKDSVLIEIDAGVYSGKKLFGAKVML